MAGYLTVLLDAQDIERSIAFYALLGFEIVDLTRDGARIGWARIHCEGGGAIMFVLAAEGEERHRAHMYLYTDDLAALQKRLHDSGVDAGEIYRPPYMPSGELRVEDPDGNVIFVGHWGADEQQAWERQLDEKRKAGLLPPLLP